ncbi:hypothetical protein [Enterococcus avium]|uniref:hypothetical protein n=1 Tax=Enterococcus avium TaxID=33945 RepID=UPI00187C44BB|nr:hypothetical protein [Enterococcus avium]
MPSSLKLHFFVSRLRYIQAILNIDSIYQPTSKITLLEKIIDLIYSIDFSQRHNNPNCFAGKNDRHHLAMGK